MIVLQEAIVIIVVSVVLYYSCEYTAHHRSHELFDSSQAGAHEARAHCERQRERQTHTRSDAHKEQLVEEEERVGECFFSENYDEARVSFVEMARRAKADQLFDLPSVRDSLSVSDSSRDANLTSQVAVFAGHPRKFLVHISGTHGVEAYAGSAIQLGILQYLGDVRSSAANNSDTDLPTIVLVHALNPFGFKYNRRTNEDNVDLNRNFLTDEQWAFVKERDPNYADYVNVMHVLNPVQKPFRSIVLNEVYSLFQLGYIALKYGVTNLKRAMVSGNYHFQRGYGFGGFELTKSNKNLMDLLITKMKIPATAEAVVLLDVHTGLGPMGVDTLFFSTTPSFTDVQMESIFPSEHDKNNPAMLVGALKASSLGNAKKQNNIDGAVKNQAHADAETVASGYDLTIGTTEAFCTNFLAPHLSDERRVCVSQEFGTVPVMMVGKYAVDENYAHFYGSAKEKAYYGPKFQDCFYVQTNEWRRKIFSRGMKLFLQGLAHISKLGPL